MATRLRRLIEQRTPVFWQEVFDNNEPVFLLNLKRSYFSNVRTRKRSFTCGRATLMKRSTKGSNRSRPRVIRWFCRLVGTKTMAFFGYIYISNFRYLNYIKYGADWRDVILGSVPSNSGYLKKISPNSKYYNFRYYNCDPQNFTGSQEQKDLVYGGIAAMWGEFVDNTNIEARFWYVLWKSNNSLFLYITLGHEVPQ